MCSLFCVALPLRHASHARKKEYLLLNKREVPVDSGRSRESGADREGPLGAGGYPSANAFPAARSIRSLGADMPKSNQ